MVQALENGQHDPLLGPRRRADYNAAERWLSRVMQHRLLELLEGHRDRLELLRRYPKDPNRLGVIPTPPDLPRDQLRLPVVEQLAWDAVEFIREDTAGGPISQTLAPDGTLVEMQTFPTKYPHVLIERIDRYDGDDPEPSETTWCLRRVQNQRRQVEINRLVDVATLAVELVRSFR